MKLKAGMKVKIVDKLPISTSEVRCGWIPSMEKMLGKEVAISRVVADGACVLKGHSCYWDFRLLEPITKVYPNIEAMAGKVDTRKLQKALPQGIKFEKIIVNGGAIICFAEHEGKRYKTVTKCHAEDTFDLQKGMEISAYKLMNRVSTYKIHELSK